MYSKVNGKYFLALLGLSAKALPLFVPQTTVEAYA